VHEEAPDRPASLRKRHICARTRPEALDDRLLPCDLVGHTFEQSSGCANATNLRPTVWTPVWQLLASAGIPLHGTVASTRYPPVHPQL
jgi:hypothetical protein